MYSVRALHYFWCRTARSPACWGMALVHPVFTLVLASPGCLSVAQSLRSCCASPAGSSCLESAGAAGPGSSNLALLKAVGFDKLPCCVLLLAGESQACFPPSMYLNDPFAPTVLNWLSSWQWREGFVTFKPVGNLDVGSRSSPVAEMREKYVLHLPMVVLSRLKIGCLQGIP